MMTSNETTTSVDTKVVDFDMYLPAYTSKHPSGSATPPPLRSITKRLHVCGYILTPEFFIDYGKRHGKGYLYKSDGFWNNIAINVITKIKRDARLPEHTSIIEVRYTGPGAICDGKIGLCLAFASNMVEGAMRMPPEKTLKALREILETEEPPRWYARQSV